ncbi:MAG TPA: hypothetical protein VES20_10270 [Bryobacteraceae bacterium]|nr:hypothetical protein [Bryobacteraceae bacterium]
MMNTLRPDTHLSEAQIEDFAFGRLRRESAPIVVEHLMVCDECNERLEAEQSFREDLREAVARSQASSDVQVRAKNSRKWLSWISAPSPAWAAAAACAVLLLFVPILRQGGGAPSQVDLKSYRGSETAVVAAGSTLSLKLDTTSLDNLSTPHVSVVDSSGRSLWQGAPQKQDEVWTAAVDTRLRPGLYWVRITEAGRPDQLLREFRLQVK